MYQLYGSVHQRCAQFSWRKWPQLSRWQRVCWHMVKVVLFCPPVCQKATLCPMCTRDFATWNAYHNSQSAESHGGRLRRLLARTTLWLCHKSFGCGRVTGYSWTPWEMCEQTSPVVIIVLVLRRNINMINTHVPSFPFIPYCMYLWLCIYDINVVPTLT